MKGRIFQIMQSQQMTQRDFASALGISPSSLSSIFNGHTSPTNNIVQAVHRRFPEISIAWLMFGEGEMMIKSEAKTNDISASDQSGESVHRTIDSTQAGVDADSVFHNPGSDAVQGNVIIRETVKYIDKPQRRITEIHVFYDDGTFETFSGKKD